MKKYLVWCPEHGEERVGVHPIEAIDEQDAALDWADASDHGSAEFSIAQGNPVTVLVAEDREESDPVTFTINGEYVPAYYARRVP